MLLVPSDPLYPRRCDEHFAEEAKAARELGIHVALVDHDALTRSGGAEAAVARVAPPDPPRDAIYRGWMLRSEQYAEFAAVLAAKGITLRTSSDQYRCAHELPGWYEALTSVTPTSVWTHGSSQTQFRECCSQLGTGSAILRDYSKSMKHYWHEAMFIPDVADADAAWRVAVRFLELREESFVGGFVLRRFESFRGSEVRTWWVDGKCALVTAHPDADPLDLPPDIDLAAIVPSVARLKLPFVTVDLALREDGVWRVVELGDGQVSDRPRATPAGALLHALSSAVGW
jgi:ATP-grasp domain, R2K clade family 3